MTALDELNVQNGVSGVASTFSADRSSSGPPPRAQPSDRSRTTCPWRRTHRVMAGLIPRRNSRSVALQMRSTPSAVMPTAAGSVSAALRPVIG